MRATILPRGDPVGDLGVDGPLASSELARTIRDVAATYACGRVAYCLEGGYDVDTLARSIEATLRAHDGSSGPSNEGEFASIPQPQRHTLERIAAW